MYRGFGFKFSKDKLKIIKQKKTCRRPVVRKATGNLNFSQKTHWRSGGDDLILTCLLLYECVKMSLSKPESPWITTSEPDGLKTKTMHNNLSGSWGVWLWILGPTFSMILSIWRFWVSISLPMSRAMWRRLPMMPPTCSRFSSISFSRASSVTLNAQTHKGRCKYCAVCTNTHTHTLHKLCRPGSAKVVKSLSSIFHLRPVSCLWGRVCDLTLGIWTPGGSDAQRLSSSQETEFKSTGRTVDLKNKWFPSSLKCGLSYSVCIPSSEVIRCRYVGFYYVSSTSPADFNTTSTGVGP